MTERKGYPGYEEFLAAEKPVGLHSFHWPVAPGDWWSPNITADAVAREIHDLPYKSCTRSEYAPGDVINGLINQWTFNRKPVDGLYTLSFWGGDDTYLSMNDADQRLTLPEMKRLLLGLPNPVSRAYLKSLSHDNCPLFMFG